MEDTKEFVNPFEAGVSYADFKKAIPKGKTIKEYCNGKLSEDEINWIEDEIKHFDSNNVIEEEEVEEEVAVEEVVEAPKEVVKKEVIKKEIKK